MAESFTAAQQDLRTFGDQQTRLLADLNRPNLQNLVEDYLRDAMRFFSRKPFFFNDTDNTALSDWAAATIYPQGSTILTSIAGTSYIIVALNEGTSGAVKPTFPTTLFTVPSSPAFPPPAPGTPGTVIDNSGVNQIDWATVAIQAAGQSIWTQLTTVYGVNVYDSPIDWVAPELVEVTWSGNLRIAMPNVDYKTLRSYDVIRPDATDHLPHHVCVVSGKLLFLAVSGGLLPHHAVLSYRSAASPECDGHEFLDH